RKAYYNGLLYFGHNFYNQSKDNKTIVNTQFYATEASSFKLSILTNSRTLLNKLLLIFWLALQFGGFGSRARRCFGNLKILSEKEIPLDQKTFSFKNTYSDIEDYKDIVKKNLKIIKQEFGISSEMGETTKKIPCLKDAQLFYSKPYSPEDEKNNKKSTSQMADAFKNSSLFKEEDDSSWIKAINYAGATMQIFRSLKNPDHDAVHDFSSLNKLERAAFGLPLEFRFTDRSKVSKVSVNHYNENDEATRFASPVIVSTTEIGNDLYVQYLILPFDFNELNVKASNGGTPKKIKIDDSVIDQFKHRLENPHKDYIKFKYEELKNAF
ncbi:MAG: hypothetical protein ACE5HI_04445, partial [bacterium]